jgi:hypothetical protein
MELKAICINDQSEEYKDFKAVPKREKVNGITRGKEYKVKQSQYYDNYYELINDDGELHTYKKSRFKVDGKKTWLEKFYEEKGKEIVEEIVSEILEGEKMEEKTLKVRCINAKDNEKLEENRIYTVKKEYGSSYSLEEIKQHDYQFDKNRFEKVEDVLMVECMNEGLIKLNKENEELKEDNKRIQNKIHELNCYMLEREETIQLRDKEIESLNKKLEDAEQFKKVIKKLCEVL